MNLDILISKLSLEDRYHIAKILTFLDYKLVQTHNGVYIHLSEIDIKHQEIIKNEIYRLLI
jgi:hypothetical protein